MRIMMPATALLAAAAMSVPAAAPAQRNGEMTLFSAMRFSGARYTVSGPRETVSVPYTVRSIRVTPGTRWEICSRSGYRDCIMISEDIANITRTVASARPYRAPQPPGGGQGPGGPGQGGGPGGPSLRGMSAEFFRAPESRGQRIECRQGSGSCASESADRFCRGRGWSVSTYERLETVRGRSYLADVLCTRGR